MALQEANVRRAEDARAGVVRQALALARRRGSDVRGASQARPTRTRATSLMLLMSMQCCWHGWCVDGHACGAVGPSQGAGGSRVRAGARLERSRVAQ